MLIVQEVPGIDLMNGDGPQRGDVAVAQVLHLLNSDRVHAKLTHEAGAIARLVRGEWADEDTLALERERGFYHFLLPYSRRRPYALQPARCQFLDSELALMLGVLGAAGPAQADAPPPKRIVRPHAPCGALW